MADVRWGKFAIAVDAGPLLTDIAQTARFGPFVIAMKAAYQYRVERLHVLVHRAYLQGLTRRSRLHTRRERLTMGDETARDPIFPATCARCGGGLSEPVSFCPHCGTHARFAFGDRAPTKKPDIATASATASAINMHADVPRESLWPSRPTRLFASADSEPYGDARAPSLDGTRRWGLKTGTALTLLAFVVLCGGAVLLHRHEDTATREQQAASSIVEGSVTANDVSRANQASTTVRGATIARGSTAARGPSAAQSPTTGQSPTMTAAVPPAAVASSAAPTMNASPAASVQPVAPAVTDRKTNPTGEPVASAAMSEPAPPPATVQRPSQPSSPRLQNAKASSPRSTASDKKYDDKNHRLMSLALARAHSGLDKNDLHMARSGIYWALSLQPDNREALMLKQDLLSRERARAIRP